jgi:hypothetical protein
MADVIMAEYARSHGKTRGFFFIFERRWESFASTFSIGLIDYSLYSARVVAHPLPTLFLQEDSAHAF